SASVYTLRRQLVSRCYSSTPVEPRTGPLSHEIGFSKPKATSPRGSTRRPDSRETLVLCLTKTASTGGQRRAACFRDILSGTRFAFGRDAYRLPLASPPSAWFLFISR